MNRKWIALIPFGILLVLILIFYITGLYHDFNFKTIQAKHFEWKNYAQLHPMLAALYFLGIYIFSVLLILPDSTILAILGGFLFPMPLAILYACLGETIGGTLFYLAARLAFSETLDAKRKQVIHEFHVKYHPEHACFLLFLRMSHLLPFWLVNLGAGLFKVKLRTFLWTTFFGVLPLAFILVLGGEKLSIYFETHTHFSLREFLTPDVKIALIGLGCLALAPIIYKKFKKN
ncbi:MAG: VTT domain-containing protein [Candidatus Melainabacteria bacterium]|nr:VTT domain-containing protein [Candidatus Melainabacteria bacterium]